MAELNIGSRHLTDHQIRLMEKWRPLVDDLRTDRMRANCAQVLENQEKYFKGMLMTEDELKEARELAEAGGTASVAVDTNLTGISRLRKVIIPMVRRIFPELIANDVVGVQPMDGPVGLAYALRFIFQTTGGNITAGNEAAYNTIDRNYTGPYSTSDAERLEASEIEGGSSGNYSQMGLKIASQIIRAKSRAVKAIWTLEAEQDLAKMHNLKLEDEVSDILSFQLAAETDQEILYYLKQIAQAGGVYTWTYTTGGGAGADGRWEQEIFRTFYTKLLAASNDIARATRRGPGNFVIASINVCAMLESLGVLFVSPVPDTKIDTGVTATSFVGKIGRFNVYRDLYSINDDYAVVGYKGPRDDDAGLIYCPYVPVMFSKAVGQDSFAPRLGAKTRYAIAESLLGCTNYYRYIDVNNLSSAMGTFTASSTAISGTSAYTETTDLD